MTHLSEPREPEAAPEGATEKAPIRGALAGLSLSMALASLSASIASVALPTLAQAFAAPFQQVQWILLAYLLATTSLAVGVGRLGDIVGRRTLLLAGLIAFTAASALCGAAPSLWLLLAARAAQGIGAAVMLALTMAFVGETVPNARTGRAMGLLATMSAVGTALGPSLGGVLIVGFGWRAIFFVNVPLGLLAFVLVWRFLPADRGTATTDRARFDLLGTLLLAGAVAAYALATTMERGHFGATSAMLLAVAVAAAGLFVVAEAKVASPLIRPAAFRTARLGRGLAANVIVFAVIMTTLVVGPFYLSRALGLGEALVGLLLSIGPATGALTGVLAGRIVDRFGAPAVVVAGLAQMAAGSVALAVLPPAFGLAGYLVGIAVLVLGYVLFQAANNTAVMVDVPPDQRGVVSGMITLSRNLGLITGAAVMGAVFAVAAGTGAVTTAAPEAIVSGMRTTFAVAAGLIVLALAITGGGGASARPAVPVSPRVGR